MFLSDSIDALLAEGAVRAEAALVAAPDDSARAALYFWLGSAYGYRARQAELQGKYWRASREAGRMRGALERALELDPSCVDCLLGLAVYEYGLARASALARLVARIIGLGGGNADRAMGMFQRVADEGVLTRTEGQWLYASALIREAERDASLRGEALRIVAGLAEQYPDNPVFRRFLYGPGPAP